MTLYEQMKQIVANKQSEEIDGYLVDMTSANLYVTIHDNLNDINRGRFAQLDIASAISLAWKLIN